MSIAAAYLVSDGVVLGADSSSTVTISDPSNPKKRVVGQLLSHSQKLFEVGTESRIGICTWGSGGYGDVSHRTIVARLADMLKEDVTIKQATDMLSELALPLVEKTKTEFVGYYVGGWDVITHEPTCYKLELSYKEDMAKSNISPLPMGGCEFSGTTQFFIRVFWGFDPRLPDNLIKELKAELGSNTPVDFDKKFKLAFDRAFQPLLKGGIKDLPIREAIDFVYSYLHITVKAEKFGFGAPTCGGPIDVGFITTDRPFRWVCHKPFSSALIEQEGEYDIDY